MHGAHVRLAALSNGKLMQKITHFGIIGLISQKEKMENIQAWHTMHASNHLCFMC